MPNVYNEAPWCGAAVRAPQVSASGLRVRQSPADGALRQGGDGLMVSRASWFACILTTTLGAGAALAATSPRVGPDATTSASQRFNAELVDELAKADPRSMALASTLMPLAGNATSAPARSQADLLAEAARRAPDDVLVQWLAALLAPADATLSPAARALLRLEPGNGAAWMFDLQASANANDADGVTEALRRIGAAARFDTHFADVALAWEAIHEAHPAPPPTGNPAGFQIDEQPLIRGIASAAAVAMPALQSLLRACSPGNAPLGGERRKACIAAGRLMVDHSTEQASMAIGTSILEKADAPDRETARRTFDYLQQTYVSAFEFLQTDEAAYRQFAADWRETRSEPAVIGRLFRRAGLPMKPPADWKPLSTESVALRDSSLGR
ncbi:hypothetical protein SAMN05216289_12835 [Dokdonella immobilis]|uniref:Uncharacterized protein n=1 Tax=Dokdonella immobilis TaxID=578942 RepID=A0A1I4ZSR9_9GAMM|nr:hypothetical protein SAMN05216289_12835 [Dokdonella immobilis]